MDVVNAQQPGAQGPGEQDSRKGRLESLAFAFTAWAEKWFPDAFVFVVLTLLAVVIAALAIGAAPLAIANEFGVSFWSLIPFTMQMSMVVIAGYVVAASPPCARLIDRLTLVPKTGPGAVAFVALVSMLASFFNWALSLVLGGLLVRALSRRTDLKMDYRAGGAAAYLGLGATWALGLSSSSAMLQANAASMPKSISDITGVIPLSQTIFLPQSMLMAALLLTSAVLVSYFSAPRGDRVKTAADLGCDVSADAVVAEQQTRPGDWFEFSPILPILIIVLALGFVWSEFAKKGPLLAISNLNTYNFIFLTIGLLLHRTIRSFLRAVSKAVPACAGVIIQFPFYGAIAGLLTHVTGTSGHAISHYISNLFVSIASTSTFPIVIGIYSAILGFLVPSGGGKWIIEAPYMMQAAKDLHAHMGWAVEVYNAAEALPNLINPFWMLPLLGILGLKAKDIVGFCFTQLLFSGPLVMILLWGLALTLNP